MFLNTTALIQRVIVRLRMVGGASVQLYAEDAIRDMLQETYNECRSIKWWDHLMSWQSRQLDGVTGTITTPIIGAAERFRDVQNVYFGNNSRPLPIMTQFVNPFRLNGTHPRFVEPLSMADDAAGELLFRIWPLQSVTAVDKPIRARVRTDPANIFDDVSVVVPFDAAALINGAAAKYAADDGTGGGTASTLSAVYRQRMSALEKQHDMATIELDSRNSNPGLTEWAEEEP